MATSFAVGALAGWAIAIPVGTIAVLVVEIGIRRGFRIAAAAGAGVASADGLYAALGAAGALAVGPFLEPAGQTLRLIATSLLFAVGLSGLLIVKFGPRRAVDALLLPAHVAPTYLRGLGSTLINPMPAIYFATLILALPELVREPAQGAAFVVGAFAASLSWRRRDRPSARSLGHAPPKARDRARRAGLNVQAGTPDR